MKKRKILFIINPVSGVGRQKKVEKAVTEYLDIEKFDFDIAYTEYAGHATTICSENADQYDIIAIAGGDGSVNEAASGLVQKNASLAIIPCGSGNGLARHLGIPIDLVKAIRLINNGRYYKMDACRINDNFFFNVSGIGFDAHIAHLFADFGKRGFVSYLKLILREVKRYKGIEFSLKTDAAELSGNCFLMAFGNSSQWGNNGFIAPLADVSDGLIDVVILRKPSLWLSPLLAYKLLNKTLHTSKYIEYKKTTSALLQLNDPVIAHYDGEPVVFKSPLQISIEKQALSIIAD